MSNKQTVLVTGASRGIGAAVLKAFLTRGYQVVANSLTFSRGEFSPAPNLALVEGDMSQETTAEKMTETAISRFGTIDHVVNNAGIFAGKAFTDYSEAEFDSFISINLKSFLFLSQLAVKQMLSQGTGGSITTITAALADNPIAGSPASIPMITKGGLNTVTRSLASEYAARNIRFNAVAPGVVDTPLHEKNDKNYLKSLTPMGVVADAEDVADAVLYLAEARYVTGEVLHVDGGAHIGKW
ncbi:MAG: SDR family oxidoreductase [Acidobacteriales bacterium]|nr:SDR family oxidoreductase [Terriglobales bacterium]